MGDPLFGATGIHVQTIIAGFLGGVGRALMPPFVSAWNALATIMLGAVTAAYLTDTVLVLGHIPDSVNHNAAAFIVGMTAMTICQGIVSAVGKVRISGGRKNAP